VAAGSAVNLVVSSGPATANSIVGFALYNADNDQFIANLVDGGTVTLTGVNVGANLNVEAIANNPEGATQSVGLVLSGPTAFSRIESGAPYMLGGDTAGDIFTLASGALTTGVAHTITATPFSGNGLGGTQGTPLTITFTIQ